MGLGFWWPFRGFLFEVLRHPTGKHAHPKSAVSVPKPPETPKLYPPNWV